MLSVCGQWSEWFMSFVAIVCQVFVFCEVNIKFWGLIFVLFSLHLGPVFCQQYIEIRIMHRYCWSTMKIYWLHWITLMHKHAWATQCWFDVIISSVTASNEPYLSTLKPLSETAPAVRRNVNGWMVTWNPSVKVSLCEATCCICSAVSFLSSLTKHSPLHQTGPASSQTDPQSLCSH